jgi:histidinol-phosphate aminotransferase
MSKFLDDRFQSLEEYVPGEQPKDTVYTKLNTNESPYPPGPATIKAVCGQKGAEDLRLYSDPDSTALKDAIAKRYEVKRQNVFVSNGSDDILNFAFMAFAQNGAVFPEISYGFYEVFAALHHVKYEKIPLVQGFNINPENYWHKNKLIVIANPNAPTGRTISQKSISDIAMSNPESVVLIDEAYIDFGGSTAAAQTKIYKNLLVVQTFSKSRSLAGARLGFAIGSRELIGDLEKIKYSTNPYNVNRITAAAGVAALSEDDYYQANCKKIMRTREQTVVALEKLGFEVIHSMANFIFVRSEDIDGEELYEKLKEKKILIRHFDNPAIKQYNRITIGTPEEMEILLAAVGELMSAADSGEE